MRQLTDDNTYLFDRDFSAATTQPPTNRFVYETQVFRTKLNYQFTRAWSARLIVEYDSTLANPFLTSLVRTKQVQTQALLTWLPHPGTVIYLGYNNDLQNYSHQLCTPAAPTAGPLAFGDEGGNRLEMGKADVRRAASSQTCNQNQPILPRSPAYLNDGRQFFLKASYLLRF